MKKFLAFILAVVSVASVAALAACDNSSAEEGTPGGGTESVYVPEDGAVYAFSEVRKFDVVTDGVTTSAIEMVKDVYAECTLTFSDETLVMAHPLQVEDAVMTYEYNDEFYECTIVNDISAELGVVQETWFTATADELILYSHVTIADNDGHHTEQFGEMVFVIQS